MPFTAIDDAPAGFTALDDAPSGFTPLDDEPSQGPAPEGAVMSAVRTGLSSIVPAIGTALGAAGAGLLATPETVGLGTIPAAVAGGFAGKELQNYVLGPEFVAQNEAQMAANRKAHEIASGAGEIVPTLVSMAGGGGAVPKLLGIGERAVAAAGLQAGTKEAEQVAAKAIAEATSGFSPSAMAIRSAESALGGARLGASQTAQQPDATVGDFANNIAKSAVEFGPLGILPHAETLAKALGYSVPQSAITTLAGNAYDALVNGQPMDFQKIKDQGLANVIPFALFNAVAHGVGLAGSLAPKGETKVPEVEHELDAPIAQAAAAGQPKTAEALADYKKGIEKQTGTAADIFPPNENTENRPVQTDDQGNTGPSLLGTEGETASGTATPEIPDPFNPQPVEENALPIESTSGVLQHSQEGTGEAGSERERMEPSIQGEEAATEGQPPTEGTDAQAGGDVDEDFAAKNEAVNKLLAENDLPAAEKLASRNLTEEQVQSDARFAADPVGSNARAENVVQRQLDNPQHNVSVEEQGLLATYGRALRSGLNNLSKRMVDPLLTPEDRADARVQYLAMNDKLKDYGQANTFAGSQPALVMRMRQIAKGDDMDLGKMLMDLHAIKGDKGITPQEDAEVREMAAKAQDLQRQKDAAEANTSKAEKINEITATTKAVEKVVRKSGGKKRLSSDQKKNLLDTIFGKNPRNPTGEILSSTPIEEGGTPTVTIHDQNQAVSKLKESEIGRKVLRDAIIVPDWQRAIAHSAFEGRDFSAKEYETIKKSEGFFDPQTGKAVVIRDQIRPKAGETNAEAVKRVLLHERVGHEGLEALRELDPKFDQKYRKAIANIPQKELDEVKELYGNNPDLAIKELIARRFEAQDPNQPPNPSTWYGQLWQAVKDFYARYIGRTSTKFDQQIRDLFRDVIHSHEALESRQGYGDVMASLPEGKNREEKSKTPTSIHEVPKSVLDRLMYEHVAAGGLEPGEKGVQEITKRMKADFEPYLGEISDDEMQKAIVNYGKEVHPTKDEVKKEMTRKNQEILLGQQIKEAKGGIIPALRQLREKGSQYARDLLKELNQTIAEKGLSRKSADEQRATRLDAKKSRVENSIQDVEQQIKDLKENKPLKERKLPAIEGDQALADAEEKLKGLRADRDQIIKERQQPAPHPGEYFADISRRVEASEKRAAKLKAKVDSGDLSVESKEKKPSHPLLDEANAKVDKLNKELQQKRADAERPAKEAQKHQDALDDAQARIVQLEAQLDSGDLSKNPVKRKAVSDELQAKRDQIKGLNEAIRKARSDAEKPAREAAAAAKELQDAKDKVAEVQRKLASGEIEPEQRPQRSVPQELQAEKDKLTELNKERADAWKELNSHTPITEEMAKKALDILLKGKQAKIDSLEDFNRRVANGEQFERPVKKQPLETSESQLADTKIKRLRAQKEDYFRRKEYAERPSMQKFWDNVVKLKRAFVLSSYGVFGKLAAAAHVRALAMAMEDLLSTPLTKILPKGVTSKARIEAHSSVNALVKAASDALWKGMKDAADIVRTGQSDLDIQHGKLKGLDEGVTSWLGRLHGAVKAPIKRAAFTYAYEKQMENYARYEPQALSDPMTQLKIQAEAYKYANRAIFMQDNALTTAFSQALNYLHNKGGGAAGIARFARILLPIVKVPTNIAHEILINAAGIPIGLGKLAKAWHAGFDNLSKEESDMIMSHIKKGSIGGAVMLMGFFNPQIAGGYYNRGIKRKDNEPEYGGFEINGVKIPKWMTHAPIFEAMQMGATMRRVADSRVHGEQRGMTSGALAGLFGLASEVPFVNEAVRSGDLQSPEGREKWLGQVAASQVVPAGVSQYARQTDVNASGQPNKRQENTFKQVLQSNIPGQRQKLPLQKPHKP